MTDGPVEGRGGGMEENRQSGLELDIVDFHSQGSFHTRYCETALINYCPIVCFVHFFCIVFIASHFLAVCCIIFYYLLLSFYFPVQS